MRIKNAVSLVVVMLTVVFANAQTADVTEGCAPMVVNFTAPAGAATWLWDFKDGATSNLQNPGNTFLNPGTYVVEFRETTSGPVSTITIKVYAKPDLTITRLSETTGCIPFNVTVSVGATLPGGVTLSGYNWDFADGTSVPGTPASHTYVTAGVYNISVKLTTSSVSCDVTKTFSGSFSFSDPPATAFSTSPDPPSSCSAPLTVNFTNNSGSSLPLSHKWDMGNGTTFAGETPPAQTYTVAGTYTVSLVATDANNCAASAQKIISIGAPSSSFSIADTVCINEEINNIANLSTAGTSLWTISNATFISPTGSTSFEPTIAFTAGGLQNVKLTTTSTGCSDDTTLFVYVVSPAVTFTFTPSYSCQSPVAVQYTGISPNPVLQWNWSFGSSVQNPVFIYTVANADSADVQTTHETFLTTLTITTAGGCKATHSDTMKVNPSWARFIPDKHNGCADLTVTFRDTSKSIEPITNWLWNYGDGTPNNSLADGNPHTHTFNSPGVYDVVLVTTNNLGCRDTSYPVRIEVGEVRTLDFSVDKTSICPGEAVQFTNLTANQSLFDGWNYSSGEELLSHCFPDDEPSLIFDSEAGPQSITLTADYNGCFSSVTKTNLVNVKGPIAGFNYQYSCDNRNDVQLTDLSEDATGLSWDFGDGAVSSSGGTFVHTYTVTGDFTITLTAANGGSGCPPSTDTYVARIRNIESKFTTDSLLCGLVPHLYDASASVDVSPSCYKGYTWIFSDPGKRPVTVGDPATSLTFSLSGTQTVGLVTEDINGCTDTLTKTVRVFNIQPSYTVSDQRICLPDTVIFTDISISDTTLVAWNWNFGDMTSGSFSLSATHVYTVDVSPQYTTTLTVSDVLGCTTFSTDVITVYSPVSSISTVPVLPNICLGQPVLFTGADFTSEGSNLSFAWDFGDGNSGTGNNLNYTYSVSGTKNVTMNYTEVATGCTGPAVFQTINIQDYPVAGYYTDVDSLNALCYPQQVNFYNASTSASPVTSTSWNWGFGSGFDTTAFVTFPKGEHPVKLLVETSFGCRDSMTKILNVKGPLGTFDIDNNNICKGDQITFTITDTVDVGSYNWDFGDGTAAADTSPVAHIYNYLPPSGQTLGKLTIFSKDKTCPVAVEKPIFIYYVKSDFLRNTDDLDTLMCLGEGLLLTNTSSPSTGNIYSWTMGDGSTSASPGSFIQNYTVTGTYTITLAAEHATYGCKDTLSKAVKVFPLPHVKASVDTTCKFKTAQLLVADHNPVDSYDYSWTPAAELNNPLIYNPTLTAINSGYYKVVATDTNGCMKADSAFLFVVPPLEGFTWDTAIVAGDYVTLPIDNWGGLVEFTWTPEDYLNCLDCAYPVVDHVPIEDKSYSLYAEDIFGCTNATFYFNVKIRPEAFIELPTTFTPNGDGANDIIYVKGWAIKDLLTFQVYNRWGEIIFETSELSEGWNGYYKGVLQNNETYVYKARAIDWFEKEIQKEGHINLVR